MDGGDGQRLPVNQPRENQGALGAANIQEFFFPMSTAPTQPLEQSV